MVVALTISRKGRSALRHFDEFLVMNTEKIWVSGGGHNTASFHRVIPLQEKGSLVLSETISR